jgi:hypothetical protein
MNGLVRIPFALLIGLSLMGCATRVAAIRAKYLEPEYVVTRAFFEESPRHIAILPFTTRSVDTNEARTAESCRRVFYQHIVLRDFDTLNFRAFDAVVLGTNQQHRATVLGSLDSVVRRLDIIGLTTVLDLDAILKNETIQHVAFEGMIQHARENFMSDAYCLGIARSYGRFYAVLFSSVGISTRVEMRSFSTGRLLWGAETRRRNITLPLTLELLAIPEKLIEVWFNSRGEVLGSLAYQVYGDLCQTMPCLSQKTQVFVETTARNTRYFTRPTCWMFCAAGSVPRCTRMGFVREENGWFECRLGGGSTAWIFRDDAQLVDETGAPVDARADARTL